MWDLFSFPFSFVIIPIWVLLHIDFPLLSWLIWLLKSGIWVLAALRSKGSCFSYVLGFGHGLFLDFVLFSSHIGLIWSLNYLRAFHGFVFIYCVDLFFIRIYHSFNCCFASLSGNGWACSVMEI